jgi:hypothetical protein
MKKLTLILLAAFSGGCATYDISDKGGYSMASVSNTSWEFLSFLPIASGNPDRPNTVSCLWLQDSANLENNIKILNAAMAEAGANGTRNLSSSIVDETVFFILINRRVYQTSAELVYGREIPAREIQSK